MSEVQPVHSPPLPATRAPVAKPAARRASATMHYPESDGKPMAESAIHWQATVDAALPLQGFFRGRPDVFVGSDQLMYYEEGNPRRSVAPDVYVAFGVPAEPLRKTWLVWVEGKAPDFVLEVTSASTRRVDEGRKKDVYAMLAVAEYWQFDPTGDYLHPILKGRRLGSNGRYQDIVLEERDGVLAASSLLGLELHLAGGRLRFFDPKQGVYLKTYTETEGARLAAEAARDSEARARREAEDARREAEDARREAEARIAELERRLRGE